MGGKWFFSKVVGQYSPIFLQLLLTLLQNILEITKTFSLSFCACVCEWCLCAHVFGVCFYVHVCDVFGVCVWCVWCVCVCDVFGVCAISPCRKCVWKLHVESVIHTHTHTHTHPDEHRCYYQDLKKHTCYVGKKILVKTSWKNLVFLE